MTKLWEERVATSGLSCLDTDDSQENYCDSSMANCWVGS
jgi:hypothetical protein